MLEALETEAGDDRAGSVLEDKAQFPDTVRRAREAAGLVAPHFTPVRRLPRKTTNPGQTMPHCSASDTADLVREKPALTTLTYSPCSRPQEAGPGNPQAYQNMTVEKIGYFMVAFNYKENAPLVSHRLRPRSRRGPEG